VTRRATLAAGLLLALVAIGSPVRATNSAQTPIVAPTADRRGEQTFLTFPEWFLVFSPAEYAQLVRTHNPDDFCFWGHIGQFWRGYASVIHETRVRREPTNWGYHSMIVVIGVSTTVEYAIRSAYETLVGRISGALAGARTPEDVFAAQVAQEYVDFIRVRPWYEFDFTARLKRLWMQTSAFGPHLIRKWERRYALTTEYAVKAVYGKLIEKATHSAYEQPIDSTSVVVDGWPNCDQLPLGANLISRPVDSVALLALPRYEAFMAPAMSLARCGAHFQEIAGNRTIILISAIGPVDAPAPPDSSVMMRQPIITQHGRERVVLIVPVAKLGGTLQVLESRGLTLEHIFDY
jgi:hypothetical protein